MIVRDELAITRTVLANERTLLAYLRSGVALFIAGISMIHFSQEGWFWAVGVAALPGALIAILVGIRRYRRMDRRIGLHRASAAAVQDKE